MVREARLYTQYETPKIKEVARVLDDSRLDTYKDSVKSSYGLEIARATLLMSKSEGGELASSTPFMLVHLQNAGLLKPGERIATRTDLETAVRVNPEFVAGNFVDFGLALKTAGDSYSPNNILAKRLAEQMKRRGINLGDGKLIPISALSLREDRNSAYGLIFDLNDGAKKETIQNLSKFKWSYKREKGLARAYLGRNGIWLSDNELDCSDGDGRVVVVSAEGAPSEEPEKRIQVYSQQDLGDFEKQMSLGAQIDACFEQNPHIKEGRDFLLKNPGSHDKAERSLRRIARREARKAEREEFRRAAGDDSYEDD